MSIILSIDYYITQKTNYYHIFQQKDFNFIIFSNLDNLLFADLLHNSVFNSQYPEWSLFPVRFWNVYSLYRLRSVFLILQIFLNIQQVFFYSVFLNHFKGDAVNPSAPLVFSHFFPCPPQNIQAKDTVIQRMKSALLILFGCQV